MSRSFTSFPWVEVWGSGSSGVETLRVMLRVTAQNGKIWGISASSCFKYEGVLDTSCNIGGGAPPILSPAKSFPKIRSTPGTGSSATATGHHPQNSPEFRCTLTKGAVLRLSTEDKTTHSPVFSHVTISALSKVWMAPESLKMFTGRVKPDPVIAPFKRNA